MSRSERAASDEVVQRTMVELPNGTIAQIVQRHGSSTVVQFIDEYGRLTARTTCLPTSDLRVLPPGIIATPTTCFDESLSLEACPQDPWQCPTGGRNLGGDITDTSILLKPPPTMEPLRNIVTPRRRRGAATPMAAEIPLELPSYLLNSFSRAIGNQDIAIARQTYQELAPIPSETATDRYLAIAYATAQRNALLVFLTIYLYEWIRTIDMSTVNYLMLVRWIISPKEQSSFLQQVLDNDKSLADVAYSENYGGLQPNPLQTALLFAAHNNPTTYFPPRSGSNLPSNGLTPYQWGYLFTTTNSTNDPPMSNILFGIRSSAEVENLQIRCRLLVDEIIQRKAYRVLLMDGHGRTMYYLLYYLSERKELLPASFEIVVTEIEPAVQQWHELLFPVNGSGLVITLTRQDVFSHFWSQQTGFNQRYLDETVVYLNFCGLGSAAQTMEYIATQAGTFPSIMVSVAYDRAAGPIIDRIFRLKSKQPLVKETAANSNGVFRTDFKTYWL